MKRTAISLSLLCCVASALAQPQKEITANEVIPRIKKNAGVAWRSEPVDTRKAGNPGTRVTGRDVTTESETPKRKCNPVERAPQRSR